MLDCSASGIELPACRAAPQSRCLGGNNDRTVDLDIPATEDSGAGWVVLLWMVLSRSRVVVVEQYMFCSLASV